jgi:hypothetical protein
VGLSGAGAAFAELRSLAGEPVGGMNRRRAATLAAGRRVGLAGGLCGMAWAANTLAVIESQPARAGERYRHDDVDLGTAASLAIHAGANPKVVQPMLGHASAAMTLDVYADLFDSDLESVADRVAELWANAVKLQSKAAQVPTGTSRITP